MADLHWHDLKKSLTLGTFPVEFSACHCDVAMSKPALRCFPTASPCPGKRRPLVVPRSQTELGLCKKGGNSSVSFYVAFV